MSEQTIQSRDIRVADVFQDFYVIPDYQREYVWGTDEVEQLLSDITNELVGADAGTAPEYFIGSIVVCPGAASGVLDLIDGQQRMTTLFVVLCAIRDRLRELGHEPPGALKPQIAAVSTDAAGNDVFRYRLDLQYEDSGGVLTHVAEGTLAGFNGARTRSITNILNAYEAARAFLRREFGDDEQRVRVFYGYLTNKVKLIRIQTEDVAKALKIFETINDRGVGLDAMDLLKNLLFMKASHDEFSRLKTTWKEMQDTIYGIGEKPLRFLRYFIFSRFEVDVLREDEIYGWFAKNEPKCGYARQPLAFADELLKAARAYRNFLRGEDQHGQRNRFLENLQILGGKAARQHLILLLAGRHLAPALFDRLAREVEELFFVYVITREPTRDFERNFARWAGELRTVVDEASFSALVERRFAPAKAELSARFGDAFARLYSDTVQQYRLRYVLGKLAQHVEIAAYGETEGTRWLSRFMSGDYEIEHIHPQTPSPEAKIEFGEHVDVRIAERLGNLTLVEKPINASLGNRPYSQKRPVYVNSRLLLTRAIAERPHVGVSTSIDTAVAPLEPYSTWNDTAVEGRQAVLARLARMAWNVPPAQTPAGAHG
jgi:hypothetical protein